MSDKEKRQTKFFCQNNIQVINEKRGYRKVRHNNFFIDPKNANAIFESNDDRQDKILLVEIPESSLDQLINMHECFYARNGNKDEMAKLIIAKEVEERNLRDSYPAVQAAWEQYSMMLHLASHPSPSA
jgi:hypothetical protein